MFTSALSQAHKLSVSNQVSPPSVDAFFFLHGHMFPGCSVVEKNNSYMKLPTTGSLKYA